MLIDGRNIFNNIVKTNIVMGIKSDHAREP